MSDNGNFEPDYANITDDNANITTNSGNIMPYNVGTFLFYCSSFTAGCVYLCFGSMFC